MKKIDSTVLAETKYIATVTLLLSLLMQAVFLVISRWDLTVLWGNLWGAFAAVLNFFLMGLTVQAALSKDEKEAKNLVKFSQSARLFLLLILAGIGYLLPCFHTIAVVVPLLFPRIGVALRPIFKKDQ